MRWAGEFLAISWIQQTVEIWFRVWWRSSRAGPTLEGARRAPSSFNVAGGPRRRLICDVDDGLIYIFSTDPTYIEWQEETGPANWTVYEGDLAVLKSSGVYTQSIGSNALADRTWGAAEADIVDFAEPPDGSVKFSLVAVVTSGGVGSLGTNSAGATRPNANPCP